MTRYPEGEGVNAQSGRPGGSLAGIALTTNDQRRQGAGGTSGHVVGKLDIGKLQPPSRANFLFA